MINDGRSRNNLQWELGSECTLSPFNSDSVSLSRSLALSVHRCDLWELFQNRIDVSSRFLSLIEMFKYQGKRWMVIDCSHYQ